MFRMKVLSTLGLTLFLISFLMGTQRLGYEGAVLMMQVGGLALVVSLFFRVWRSETIDESAPLAGLFDLEG